MTDLAVLDPQDAPLSAPQARLAAVVGQYLTEGLSPRTRRAYASDWSDFLAWCEKMDMACLPAAPGTVALYIAHLATDRGLKTGTIQRRLAAIRHQHASLGFESPTDSTGIELTMKGVRRVHGVAQQGKAAVTTPILRQLVSVCPETLIGWRDRALLLIGFAGAFRRSALVALNVDDLQFTDEGLRITIRRDKSDQNQEGRVIGIAYGSHIETCPVRTLRKWLNLGEIVDGPVFRSFTPKGIQKAGRLPDGEVARIVKRTCARAGLEDQDFAGHSLRIGFVTQATRNRVPRRAIAKQTGHKSMPVLERYIRNGELFHDNASAQIDL